MSGVGKRRGRGRGGASASAGAGSAAEGGGGQDRTLRQKSDRKQYVDGGDSDDEDLDGLKTSFSVMEKLQSPKFPRFFIRELKGDEVNVEHFQKSGFNMPIFIKEKTGLGMTVPDQAFTVTDVKNGVGARRSVEVMDCNTQRNSEMSMKEWEEYYNTASDQRDGRKLNVISLEFSFTKLEPYVIAPKVVRQIDWVDNVWPRHLKEQQTEGTNDLREMKYPKVQKYCLMSVAGCYTDFHIDFGGTSVWYHIVKGKKIFWLIPPTETNLKIYEQWTMSGKQSNVFFGDLVEKCGKVELESGNTFLIPSGWIHAVFTPEDSLVFGGNFLHSFAIEKQIRVAQIEEMTKVPHKFRFPFFTELQWFALDKYVYHLMGRTHLALEEEAVVRLLGTKQERLAFKEAVVDHPQHITAQELFGLKAIVMYIHALAVSKKNVPPLLPEPINLVRDIRALVDEHKGDDPEQAVTGRPLLYWPGIKNDPGFMRLKSSGGGGTGRPKGRPPSDKAGRDPFGVKREKGGSGQQQQGGSSAGSKRAPRVPCKICQACISPDCGMCPFCADMIRFGGSGRLRKPCQMRQCLQPLLMPSALCGVCGLDGWYAESHVRLIDRPSGNCALMECSLCFEVSHPTCVADVGVDGYVKLETPNLWECPKCVKNGLAVKLEPESAFTPSGLPTKPLLPPPGAADSAGGGGGPSPAKMPKTEDEAAEKKPPPTDKKPMAYGADSTFGGYQLFSVKGRSDQPKHELRTQLAGQILSASTHAQKEPQFVVRPPPPPARQLAAEEILERRRAGERVDLATERGVILEVFARLDTVDLSRCVQVCKTWCKVAQDPLLWSTVRLEHKKITSHLLSLIVQRQPIKLHLDWTQLGKQQLTWLLPRIPQTRTLSLCGLEYHSTCVALNTVNCPMLQELDLSYVTNFNDSALYRLLSSPKDSRPGLLDKKSRQKNLTTLRLSGTEVSDVGMRYVTQFLGQLQRLEVAGCWKLTDAGLAQLSVNEARTVDTLEELNVSNCRAVTNAGLTHLIRCRKLNRVNCLNTAVTQDAMKKFTEESAENLKVVGSVIQRRLTKR